MTEAERKTEGRPAQEREARFDVWCDDVVFQMRSLSSASENSRGEVEDNREWFSRQFDAGVSAREAASTWIAKRN